MITPFVPTSVGNGHKTVTTAGTRVQLANIACKAVSIAAKADNTGKMYLGDSSVDATNGRILEPGESIDIAIDNLNRFYLDSEVDGEGISALWVA